MTGLSKIRFKLYRFRWWWRGKSHTIGKGPVHVDIEMASDCNLRCSMCPYGDNDHPYLQRGMMDTDMAKRAVDEAGAMGVDSLKYQFRGEPGLNKHLEEIVEYSSRWPFVDKFMNTNGLAFSPSRIKRLAQAGLTRVILSVDGATRATYEKIRVQGNWDRLRARFKDFIAAGHKVQVQMTVQPDNQHEVAKFLTLWPGAKAVAKRLRQTGTVRAHCAQPYRRLIVAHDGTIFGCCNNWHNEFPVGDFRTQSLKEVWNGDRMNQLRKHAKEGTGPCANCGVGEAWKR